MTQAWLKSFPRGRLAAWLYPAAFGGFYLDERFTRLTFRLWPAPRGAQSSTAALAPTTAGASL